MKPFFMYISKCRDGSYYVGHTDDLDNRIAEHKAGIGSSYTSKRLPIELVFQQEFFSRDQAKAAEFRVKKWGRKKKEALINEDWETIRRLAECRNVSHWANNRTKPIP